MNHPLNIKLAMRVFNKIQDLGQKTQDGYIYEGFEAISSYDGYTIELKNQEVDLFIYFHSNYNIHYDTMSDVEHFMHQLEQIDKEHLTCQSVTNATH
ncbi:MAG: DUF3081 family protein [Cellvibrionales bacterium]|nr:DUF3081 family protein [Cellvibrionales bacterium]